jgi:hypothetical protein
MSQVAGAVPELSSEALARADAALSQRAAPEQFDVAAARELFARMLAGGQPQRMKVS